MNQYLRNFKKKIYAERVGSVVLLVLTALIIYLIYKENSKRSVSEQRSLNGKFMVSDTIPSARCIGGDSMRFDYSVTPPFEEREFRISIRIDSNGSSHGLIFVPTPADTLRMDSIPNIFVSVRKLLNEYKQDSSVFSAMDGSQKRLTLCDLSSGKSIDLDLQIFDDTPNSIKLNDSLNQLILESIPRSQRIGSFMRQITEER